MKAKDTGAIRTPEDVSSRIDGASGQRRSTVGTCPSPRTARTSVVGFAGMAPTEQAAKSAGDHAAVDIEMADVKVSRRSGRPEDTRHDRDRTMTGRVRAGHGNAAVRGESPVPHHRPSVGFTLNPAHADRVRRAGIG